MAIVNRSFSVNVTPGMMPPIVHVSEYDVGRAYTVSILDEQGNTFTIPSGTTVSIEGTLNGKVGFTQSATVSNNQVSFTLSQSMTAYSGKAWCKIKLTQNSQPIQTCAFILAVDRAGVEADTILHSPGFQEQINEGIAEYFDNDPPFFELPSGGQSGQALLSDGSNGAYWGQAQGGGSGLTNEAKQALLACFAKVVWVDADGQDYYDALEAALYPPADLASISAVFTQGSVVIYDTDSLDTLRQYLVVTATMSDSTTRTVTNYTLSGTLAEGTSVITVLYGGKTTTFNVVVQSNTITIQSGITRNPITGKLESASNRTVSNIIPISDNTVSHSVSVKVNGESADCYIRVYDQNGHVLNLDNGNDIPSGKFVGFAVIILSAIASGSSVSISIDGETHQCTFGTVLEFSNSIPVNVSIQGIDTTTGEATVNSARVLSDFISVSGYPKKHVGTSDNVTVSFDLLANQGVYIKIFEYTDNAFLPNDYIGALNSNNISGNVSGQCTRIRIIFKKSDNSDFTAEDMAALTLNNYGIVNYVLEEV